MTPNEITDCLVDHLILKMPISRDLATEVTVLILAWLMKRGLLRKERAMNAKKAGKICHVRGYIARKSDPEAKLWKNTVGFEQCLPNLPGNDWVHYDPEGEETSITARLIRKGRAMEDTDASIATPHWEACSTCLNFDKDNGCNVKEEICLTLHLCDFILCGDYEPKESS